MNSEVRRRVEIRAYEIWERTGRPDGRSEEHWVQAVTEIAREDAEAVTTKAKKAEPRKKAEKSKTAARIKKTSSASTARKDARGSGKKARSKIKTETGGKAKKAAK